MVGEHDRLIVTWYEIGASAASTVHVGISDDGGDSWSSESGDREISQPGRLMVDVAADALPYWTNGDGRIYAVYQRSFDPTSPFHFEI